MNNIVRTEKLTKRYGTLTALDRCDLTVDRGEVFGLLGPNGAGKSTLLRLMLGFIQPSDGRATIDGLDVAKQSVAVRRQVAYLPGDVRLFRRMKAKSVLRFFTRIRPHGDWQRACRMAACLDLDLSRRVAYMSTGMRQKLALAATLSAATPLVILDEPTANLDPNVRNEVGVLVREASREGRTVIFSSHVLSEVEESCDRVAILRQGKLVHTEEIAKLKRRHRIHARLEGQLPPIPKELEASLEIKTNQDDHIVVDTSDELSQALGWLAELPLSEINIEPLGLKYVYEQWQQDRKSVA